MNKKFYIGLAISICNLFFYAIALDLVFHSGIFPLLFHFDLVKACGSAGMSIGIGAIVIAVLIEVISYRVIRRGITEDYHQSESENKTEI